MEPHRADDYSLGGTALMEGQVGLCLAEGQWPLPVTAVNTPKVDMLYGQCKKWRMNYMYYIP